MGIVTKQEFKQYFGITDQFSDDLLIDSILEDAQEEAEEIMNRTIEAADYTEYYKGPGSQILLVNQYPINSITSIFDDTERVFGADTEIDLDDIDFQAGSDFAITGKIVYDNGIFVDSNVQSVKITYNAGYTPGNIPRPIKLGIILLAGSNYFAIKGGVIQLEGDNVDDRPARLERDGRKKLQKFIKVR